MKRDRSRLVWALVLVATSAAWGSDVLEVPGQYPTIQSAITAANDSDEVRVAPGVYHERIDLLGKEITVRSSGGPALTSIDGGNGGSVVSFLSGEDRGAVLEGFTIVGGQAGSGGGIVCISASPTIRDCVLDTNLATLGGGLYAADGGLLVERCTFAGNAAQLDGGGVWLGCCPPNNLPSEFVDCVFLGNDASRGGGVFSTGGWFEFRGCGFQSNTAGTEGGAVALDLSGGNLFENCEFFANSAPAGGAIAQVNESEATLRSSAFRGNQATGSGGAVLADATSFPICAVDCTFALNHAGDRGGALDAAGGGVDVTGCHFTENSAARGGAVAVDLASTVARFAGGSFTGNSATDGGAIYHAYIEVTVSDVLFDGNTAASGGGIHSYFARDQVSRCDFRDNSASSGGGFYSANGSGTLADCTFTRNSATAKGGGVFLNELDGHRFERCTFEANANLGLFCLFSFPNIDDSVFRHHAGGALEATDNEYGFHPTIGGTEFCANEPFHVLGPYDDAGGNTFLPWCDCLPDWNSDGQLDSLDFLAYLNAWVGREPAADVNGDGTINTLDFLMFLNLWGAGC